MQLVRNNVNDGPGYVYVLSNPSMPGLIKVGHSVNGGASRGASMYSGDTGVPTPFILEFEAFVQNRIAVEKSVHTHLEMYRVNQKREFFECEPGKAVTDILEHCRKQHYDFEIEEEKARAGQAAYILNAISETVMNNGFDASVRFKVTSECYQYHSAGLPPDRIEKALHSLAAGCTVIRFHLNGESRDYMDELKMEIPELEKLVSRSSFFKKKVIEYQE